jgi:sugar phosphate isomerase/epimerase
MPVELGLTPDGRRADDAPAVIEAAARAGFVAVGAALRAADPDTAAVYERCDVRCHELLALRVGDDDADLLARAEQLAGAAEVLGAPWVLAAFMEPLSTSIRAALPRVASVLREAGAGVAVEFVPMSAVRTIGDALELVELMGADRAGVLVDTWHFFVGESTWSDLVSLPLNRLAYVQFDDALAPDPDHLMRETMGNRRFPGEGTFELERFATTLLDRGWEGTVSVEVLSDELRPLPISEFARQAFESTSRYWR